MNYIKQLDVTSTGNSDFVYDYITDLESSKKLKSLGFNLPTYHYWLDTDIVIHYIKNGLHRVKLYSRKINHNRYDLFIYSAPTEKQVNKFLKTLSNE